MKPSARRIRRGALAAGLALAGCSGQPSGSFDATLDGPLEGTFRGQATFCTRPDRGDFLLVMSTRQDSVGFVVGREAPEVPAAGRYAVVDRADTLVGGRFWMKAELQNLEAAGPYRFEVDEGEVRIVSADSSWVKGRFRAQMIARDTAFQIDTLTRTVRRLPTEWATVEGSFSAARAESCSGLSARQ